MSYPSVSTFSLVALDPQSGSLGIAVASRFIAVGGVVPWAKAGVGALATQSYANTTFGPRALAMLEEGRGLEAIHQHFQAIDPELALRQYGVVAQDGSSLSFTGEGCHPWAGGRSGPGYAAQGNLLAGPEVVEAMAETFLASSLPFPQRLLAALGAGDEAGGDRRGRQSAALLVVAEGRGYMGFNDRWLDLRADDHPEPIGELRRLLGLHQIYMEPPSRPPKVLDPDEVRWLQEVLSRRSLRAAPVSGVWDGPTAAGLKALYAADNLSGRWLEGPQVDPDAWEYLRRALG